MTKKEPLSRKERLRLKVEHQVETERARVIEILIEDNGKSDKERRSYRDIGRMFDKSHTWVGDIASICLDKKSFKRNRRWHTKYVKKSNYRQLLKRNKPGPAKGTYSQKRKDATRDILEMKDRYPILGAAKINVMTGKKVSAPTAHDILMKAGYEPVTMRIGKVYKRFEMPFINDMWQIDYVELGTDSRTGRKVESLSVIDDNSRFIFSANARISATTDDVLELLESIIAVYGAPKVILSDHGTQWAASNGGDTRFDEWCQKHGIKHIMGRVRKPTTQGKVERWHGTMRRESRLPQVATLEEYQEIMTSFVEYYNEIRPHWSCGLKTPGATFRERHTDLAIASLASMTCLA